jgi:phage shock protein A
MKLSRQLSEVENLQAQARQALTLADRARADGDGAKATQYEEAAQTFATQLVAAESQMVDLKSLHDQAVGAAAQARKAVENNAMLLQQKLAERTKLLSQLEQAKMQETVARSLESMSELSAPGTTPSLEEVRDKIERRYAVALGRADLAQGSVEGRRLEVQKATLDMAGASRLEEIRASMTRGVGGAPAQPAVGPGETPAAVTGGDSPALESAESPDSVREQA